MKSKVTKATPEINPVDRFLCQMAQGLAQYGHNKRPAAVKRGLAHAAKQKALQEANQAYNLKC